MPLKTAQNEGCRAADDLRRAFTLVELLLVITIIAVLAGLLLPALSSAKANAKQVGCLGNLRQLEVAFQMYTADNRGSLPQNIEFEPENSPFFGTNSWVYGDMKNRSDATNVALVKVGELFSYAPQPASYQCPADITAGGGLPRVRSYSMNSWIGSAEMEADEQQTPFRVFRNDRDFAPAMPSAIWVLVDEHAATLDDGWFLVTMNDSEPFASLPATRHQNACGINFADGHAEMFHLRSAVTQLPEFQAEAFGEATILGISPANRDWIRFKAVTTSP